MGEPITVYEEGLTISDVPLDGATRAVYRFTGLFDQHHWTPGRARKMPGAVPKRLLRAFFRYFS